MGKHYLYRHIRLDDNSVFYVGIGTKPKNTFSTIESIYPRAYEKRRNKFWNRIVAKTDYRIDIMLESDDHDFIKQKEIYFIALYGRRDLKKGTLCNLTDGGEGMIGLVFTDEHKRRLSESNKGRKTSDETKLRQSLSHKGILWSDEKKEAFKPYIKWGQDHPSARTLLSLNTGIFYYTVVEASRVYSINLNTLNNMLSGHRRNTTDLIYADFLEDGIYPIIPKIKPYVNLSENNRGEKNSRSIKIINKITGELYVSVKDLCEKTGFKYHTMLSTLNPKKTVKNTTPFEYYDEEKHKHLIK